MTKRTYNSIDVAKWVGALFVAAIHANPFSGVESTIAISLFARMAVPFFFMVSAFFFFRTGYDGEKLKSYLQRLGRLYLIWFIVGLPVVIKRSFIDHEGGFGADLLLLIRNFFLGSTFRGSWFVMALMIAIPTVYYISKRLSTGWVIGIGALCYIPVTLLSNYNAYLSAGVQQAYAWVVDIFGPLQFTFLVAIVFCGIGKYLSEKQDAIERIPRWLIDVALLLSIGGAALEVLCHTAYSDDTYFMLVPVTMLLLLFVLRHEVRWKVNYSFIRNQSTVTYFAHFTFINFLDDILGLEMHTWLFYVLVVTSCFFLTIVMRWISGKKYFGWVKYSF